MGSVQPTDQQEGGFVAPKVLVDAFNQHKTRQGREI